MKNYKIITISSIILFLIIVVIPTVLSDENSKTIYVDDDGTADYISIQDAIDNASDGDTIFVYNGTYYEHITIDKPINLIGEDKEETILGGGNEILMIERNFYFTNSKNSFSLINISADNVTIKGFTIKNSTYLNTVKLEWYLSRSHYHPNYIPYDNLNVGIGIYISSNNSIISDNIIEMNGADGINLKNCQKNLISNNTIKNNTQCGIYLINSSNNYVINNTFSNDSLGIGFVYNSIYNIIYHNNFINNTINHVFHYLNDENNTFYSKELYQGNYWDDYNGSDKNNDGIGDIPYNISGERCQDLYPLMSPYYGRIVVKDFYVDQDAVLYMLWIAMIATILFLIPIAYIWYRKTRPRE